MAITSRADNYSDWYIDLVREARLADYAPVKGCMIIRPYGYAIWENIQKGLDKMFKDTGHVNAYFPLLIPKSFLSREASHVKGFAKECAVVTHYRLKNNDEGTAVIVDPESKLEEELIIRPTSETMIWSVFKDWIQSYRDLPILLNQWANVVRWEMRTRLFLRTTEFLWQEGHTAHATCEEAEEETMRMLLVYQDFAENYMAMPVFIGRKTESEKFAGALHTYCIEAMMQDKRALQAGTSHHLGQNFAKAFDVKYQDKSQKLEYVWSTSWGVSTRLIGGLIMTHSDDKGLILPPRLAPTQVVIIPIWPKEHHKADVLAAAARIKTQLLTANPDLRLHIDDDDANTPGWKFNEWELKGVPVRLELGPRDLANQAVMVYRRDQGVKVSMPMAELDHKIPELLDTIQADMLETARAFRDANTHTVTTYAEMEAVIAQGGFAKCFWAGDESHEDTLKNIQATVRCILFNTEGVSGPCIATGITTDQVAIIGKSY